MDGATGPVDATVSPIVSAGNAASTPAFSITDPSTWSFTMPSWQGWTGELLQVGASAANTVQGVASTAISGTESVFSAVADPVLKEAGTVEQGAVSAISGTVSSVWSGTKAAVGGAFSFISTPIEWAIFAIVLIGALYLLGPLVLATRRP